MASVSYEYFAFEFKRPPLDPLSENEYQLIRKDFENFMDDHLEKAEDEFKKQKNPHRFKWKTFFILLGVGGLFLGIDYTLKTMGRYDAGEIFAVLSFIPLAAIAIQPVQWFLSFMKSSAFTSYEREARTYFGFHRLKANVANSYADYLKGISATDIEEFNAFIWDK